MKPPSFATAAWILFVKDLTIELRTREIVTTGGFFAALVAVLTSVAFHAGTTQTARVAPGAIWLSIAFASILAVGRTWQREREDSALTALLLAPIPRASIFVGKALGVLVFLALVEVLVIPLVALLLHVDLTRVGPGLAPVLVLGTVGVAATGTLFGAMTVRTRARDLVLATVLFPLLSPALVTGVAATKDLCAAANVGLALDLAELGDYLLLLGVFDVVAVAGGLGLFGLLMEE